MSAMRPYSPLGTYKMRSSLGAFEVNSVCGFGSLTYTSARTSIERERRREREGERGWGRRGRGREGE